MGSNGVRISLGAAIFSLALLSIQSSAETEAAAKPLTSTANTITTPPSITSLSSCEKLKWVTTVMSPGRAVIKLRIAVKENGSFQSVTIVKSTGYRGLDHAIINMFATCRYKSGAVNGQAVDASFDTEYVWVDE